MTHPDDLLADYVDGSLAPAERAGVDAHLATCSRCRDEVALAEAARDALGAMPRAVSTPSEVGAPAVHGASRTAPTDPAERRATPDHPRWYRWVGGAAAAAAVVLAIAVLGPSISELGSGGDSAGEAATAGGGGTGAGEPPALERLPGNVTEDDLVGLLDPMRGATLSGPSEAAAEGGEGAAAPNEDSAIVEAPAARLAAAECLQQAFTEGIAGAGPLRLVSIRFQGTPAYAGVYPWSGEGGGDEERVQVVVASRADCTLLSTLVVTR